MKAPMVGRRSVYACSCCHKGLAKRERRQAKRRERQQWKREVAR